MTTRAENRKVLRTFEKLLPVKLSEKEKLERGSMLAEKEGGLKDAIEQRKAVTAHWTAKEKEIEAEMSRLALALRQGFEPRTVEVDEIADFGRNCVMHVRKDTSEVLEQETRALRDSDKQDHLFPSANERPSKSAGKKKGTKEEDRPSMDEIEDDPFFSEAAEAEQEHAL